MRIRKGIYLEEGVKGTSLRKQRSVHHLKSKVLQSNPREEGRGLTFLPYWPSLRPLSRSEMEKGIELWSLALLTLLWGSPDGKEVERDGGGWCGRHQVGRRGASGAAAMSGLISLPRSPATINLG